MNPSHTMNWSPQQLEALDKVRAWMADPDGKQVFRLFGYAGTGKTTLAKDLASGLEGATFFAAYTGKAALVLQKSGCLLAQTIHSLIYLPLDKSKRRLLDLQDELKAAKADGHSTFKIEGMIRDEEKNLKRPTFKLNLASQLLDDDVSLLVLDECSMIDDDMGIDLESFGVRILVMGDPAQLPPVAKSAGYFTKKRPDVLLTEIHRQAEGSPVLHLATMVRNGERLVGGEWGNTRVMTKAEFGAEIGMDGALQFDQIIVGKNATRSTVNKRIRAALGRTSDLPETGDKLVCLRNDSETNLLNGSLWEVLSASVLPNDLVELNLADDGGNVLCVESHPHHFEGRGDELKWFQRGEAQEFDYGYALTCHKSQGSQWAKVLVYDESRIFRKDRSKWLYTALTRAAESVTVVIP